MKFDAEEIAKLRRLYDPSERFHQSADGRGLQATQVARLNVFPALLDEVERLLKVTGEAAGMVGRAIKTVDNDFEPPYGKADKEKVLMGLRAALSALTSGPDRYQGWLPPSEVEQVRAALEAIASAPESLDKIALLSILESARKQAEGALEVVRKR